jgi:zinc transport system ATP-binding protein
MEEIISTNNLTFRFGGNEAVSKVTFTVYRGDYLALVGHNGSGKSTLVKLLLGIYKPAEGEIKLFGKDLQKFSDWQKIGYLPQNIGLFNPLFPATVAEIVSLGIVSQKKFPRRLVKSDNKVVREALEQMEIMPIKDKLIGELSGGQIQRTLLARAIVNHPKLLILDEPVSSVDAETREEFFLYASKLNKEQKTTIILVTHDVGHSVKFTNKLLFLDKKIVFYGPYGLFCASPQMENQFGIEMQHLICGQH